VSGAVGRVLVAGGGIAGPVAAMALHRAGVAAVVYEAYPTGADGAGAFLSVFANGMDALRAIGADGPVLECSFPTERVEFTGRTGRRLGEVPIGGDGGARAPRTLRRSDLYRALRDEAARRGIPVVHGRRLTGARTAPGGGVTAVFEDGTEAEGDLLVGADGIHSAVRALTDPSARRPRPLGTAVVCGRTRRSPVTAPPGTFRMVYGRRAFFAHLTAPDGETWWFAAVPPARDGKDGGPARWRERAIDAVARDRTPAADVIRATGAEDVVVFTAHDLGPAPLPRWSAGPVVVVGDAAHAASPNAGHGASMAMEDGVQLARCLRDLPDLPRALAAYEGLRRERVTRLVETSARMSRRAVPGPVGRVLRDLALPLLLRRGPRNGADWLTGHHIDWDAPAGAA
jgi:2-polyprenyl-6-methoxyphenol hydroxylase-like FAD-dependent oxidoreductase